MTVTDTVSGAGARLRVRPWRGGPGTAEVVAVPAGAVIAPSLVGLAVERARERGFTHVVTPALPRSEWRPYLDAGFNHFVVHGPGHDQERFLTQFTEDVVPLLRKLG